MDLDPAGRFFDALPGVVRPPPFYKAHPQDAQPAQVVNTDACGGGQTCGGISFIRKTTTTKTWADMLDTLKLEKLKKA